MSMTKSRIPNFENKDALMLTGKTSPFCDAEFAPVNKYASQTVCAEEDTFPVGPLLAALANCCQLTSDIGENVLKSWTETHCILYTPCEQPAVTVAQSSLAVLACRVLPSQRGHLSNGGKFLRRPLGGTRSTGSHVCPDTSEDA